jgi:hypothetical protein
MLGSIREKMATQESAPRGGRFSTSDSTIIGNGTSVCNDMCALGKDCSIITKNSSWDNAYTFDSSNRGERLSKEPNVLVQRAQRTSGSLDG